MAEKENKQYYLLCVVAMVGIVAIVGIVFMINSNNDAKDFVFMHSESAGTESEITAEMLETEEVFLSSLKTNPDDKNLAGQSTYYVHQFLKRYDWCMGYKDCDGLDRSCHNSCVQYANTILRLYSGGTAPVYR